MLEKIEQRGKLYTPRHLFDFAIFQAKNWAKAAYDAEHSLHENVDYVIKKDDKGEKAVYAVDSANTGVIQYNMVLSDGVHQFLQIKHGLRMSSESLTTSFVSNVGFFKRFGSNIYGLTGTIGDEGSQATLKEIYGINIGFMPTFKQKQLKELPI
jgi:preprotein translocase subunit SecA